MLSARWRPGYLPASGPPRPFQEEAGFCSIPVLALSPTMPPPPVSMETLTLAPDPGKGTWSRGGLALPTWEAEKAVRAQRGSLLLCDLG